MALKKGVFIMECVPKKDNLREGKLLYEFLNMLIPDRIDLLQIKSKNDFLDRLYENNSKVIHISCHGDTNNEDNFCMLTANGNIYPDELDEDSGLRGRNVVITGCLLGRTGFAKEFLENTQAKSLIAPMNEIRFRNSAMWCANFYYHLFTRNSFSFGRSYDYMTKNFYVPGAMKMWE
ncbi:MAG: hypothetical protein SCH39_08030 [Methanosarcinales archaeon]|nr:hypothetical protein [Methanosarcinales archaeon]